MEASQEVSSSRGTSQEASTFMEASQEASHSRETSPGVSSRILKPSTSLLLVLQASKSFYRLLDYVRDITPSSSSEVPEGNAANQYKRKKLKICRIASATYSNCLSRGKWFIGPCSHR